MGRATRLLTIAFMLNFAQPQASAKTSLSADARDGSAQLRLIRKELATDEINNFYMSAANGSANQSAAVAAVGSAAAAVAATVRSSAASVRDFAARQRHRVAQSGPDAAVVYTFCIGVVLFAVAGNWLYSYCVDYSSSSSQRASYFQRRSSRAGIRQNSAPNDAGGQRYSGDASAASNRDDSTTGRGGRQARSASPRPGAPTGDAYQVKGGYAGRRSRQPVVPTDQR